MSPYEQVTASRTQAQDDSAAASSSEAEPSLVTGEIVGRYRVRRLVGEGGMGRVYLARDMTLGRSVALKLVRARGISAETFIREARITAQLNHPHVVQIYDVGRHGDFPYLALEYLEGESLADRMRQERLSSDDSLRLLLAVAEALTHAHARGIWHCDLKPGNVMLPRDGRLRVVDFGLAIEATHALPSVVAGTADWMAPEQWRGEPASDRTDVWALAVMAYQLVGNRHPFGAAGDREARRRAVLDASCAPEPISCDGISDELIALMVRSLTRERESRPQAGEWVAALRAELAGGAAVFADNPFRGLSAFDERHAQFFFGREDEIDAFVERLRHSPTLPIVGPSGVGKSSFLFAGIVPRLRGSARWTVVASRPGNDPITALAHRLITATEGVSEAVVDSPDRAQVAALAEELRVQPSLLAHRLATIAMLTQTRVLLAIDQLEELFTQGVAPRDVECFLGMLAQAADDPTDPVRVTYTLRDDFLGRVPAIQALFVLRRLDDAHLLRTILGPLERLDYRFDSPAIIDEMLRDVRSSVAALPLIQFTCRALWELRDREKRLILEAAYRSQGGVGGALAKHADAVIAAMSIEEQRTSRQMLTRLVTGAGTRRIVERGELLSGLPAWSASVLERLLAVRLLTQHRIAGKSDTSIEIVHESLLVTWGQLARWLEESGDERRLLAELDEAAALWDKRGRRMEETWSAPELADARHRAEKLGLKLPETVTRFLDAGDARERRRLRGARVRWGGIIGGAVVTAMISVVLASEFRRQRNTAERQANALRLARGNLGQVALEFEPFDWIDGAARAVSLAELPNLKWRLYTPATNDVHLPGAPIHDDLVRVTGSHVEAPGGLAFLRVDGRGRRGETCAAAWIRLLALPGYAERAEERRFAVALPTCQASLATTVTIPAGEFIYGGLGVPATRYPEYAEPERVVNLPAFRIDRTEVSNSMFGPFARIASLTGYSVPAYPREGLLASSGQGASPAAAIDAFEAEAYCRYMGKRLPTDYEWTKAARGGLVLGGHSNPAPRRLYPWGSEFRPSCVNISGDTDGHEWVAPVDSLVCGASPYGVLNLAGNIAEWIARTGQTDSDSTLRVVRGGAVDSPPELEQSTTIFRNTREERHFDFSAGVRCVADIDAEKGSIWTAH